MEQGWLSSDDLGLVGELDINAWNGYLAILKTSHIRFRNEDDLLVWNQAKSGKYTPKGEYMHLILEHHPCGGGTCFGIVCSLLNQRFIARFFFQGKPSLGIF